LDGAQEFRFPRDCRKPQTGGGKRVDQGISPPRANDGILRVIEAQIEHLPKFGVEITQNLSEADVICNHGTTLYESPGVPSVSVSHGMYWSRQKWGDGFLDVNHDVVETMRHSVAHTAPSEWVARALRRGGYWYPEVVYHGIDGEKFLPSKERRNYVLWNKARADFVSNPEDMMEVAKYLPSKKFLTTIGKQTQNVRVVGPQPIRR